jgi:hypothetical protein
LTSPVSLFHNVGMKKDQSDLQNNKRAYNAKLPTDPDERVDRLMKRIDMARVRLELAEADGRKYTAYKNKLLIDDMEREILEWKRLKK